MRDPQFCFLIDGGTTNTRVWLRNGRQLCGPERLAAGVRDTAIEGTNARLKSELSAAFARLEAAQALPGATQMAVASGMITSPLGLLEVPHCPAPAGARDLAAAARLAEFAEFPGVEWIFFPGVKTGEASCSPENVAAADIMRGEETELMGAVAAGLIEPPALFIHAGSHTKAILLDRDARIVAGTTTLSGELRDVVRRHTILSSAVAGATEDASCLDLLEAGAEECAAAGLSRALFEVRLLQQSGRYSAAQLDGFLLGALIQGDLQAIERLFPLEGRVALSAPDPALPAWQLLLGRRRDVQVVPLGSAPRERCFLAGLEWLLELRKG